MVYYFFVHISDILISNNFDEIVMSILKNNIYLFLLRYFNYQSLYNRKLRNI